MAQLLKGAPVAAALTEELASRVASLRKRGIRAAGAMTVTSAVRGSFKKDAKTREEALRLLGVSA